MFWKILKCLGKNLYVWKNLTVGEQTIKFVGKNYLARKMGNNFYV